LIGERISTRQSFQPSTIPISSSNSRTIEQEHNPQIINRAATFGALGGDLPATSATARTLRRQSILQLQQTQGNAAVRRLLEKPSPQTVQRCGENCSCADCSAAHDEQQPAHQLNEAAGEVQRESLGSRFLGAVSHLDWTQASALEYAQSLDERYPNWLSILPDCPCTEDRASGNPGSWVVDPNPNLADYHPGAASSWRSKGTYSSAEDTAHGQQCTYDDSGDLIKSGPGAGTPDVWAPIGALNTLRHVINDAETFKILGASVYNQYWRPNQGDCDRGATDLPAEPVG